MKNKGTIVRAEQLPHLIRLLDDDTPLVRESVTTALLALDADLEQELRRQQITLSDDQQSVLDEILGERNEVWLKTEWADWQQQPESNHKLERGWSLLSAYMDGPGTIDRVSALLAALADAYRAFDSSPSESTLAEFLFRREGFRGARRDYDAPHNSNLAWVIENRRGIPISLCSVYMLVGARCGLDIRGCNYPGHFLCRIAIRKAVYVVDCYNGGRILDVDHAPGITPEISPSIRRMIHEAPTAEHIMTRALRNLVRAYAHAGLPRQQTFIETLLE